MSEHLKDHLEHGDLLDVGGHDEHGGNGKYIAVFIALCFLTSMSFFTYSSYWPFSKEVAWAFMMAVSCTKAMLVILFFMHVKYNARLTQLVAASGFFFLLILFGITLLDYVARGSVNPETRPAGSLQVDDK